MKVEKWGENPFDQPVNILRNSDPSRVALISGTEWMESVPGEGSIVVPVLGSSIRIAFPEIRVEAPDELSSFPMKLLSLLYLTKTDGSEPSGEWIAYRDLPGGRFYEPVVRRSVEAPLAANFGGDAESFAGASLALGGNMQEFGDASFSFRLFPKVLICFIMWKPDQEFPARAQAIYDSNCSRHLDAFDIRMGAQEISKLLVEKSRAPRS